MVHGLIEGVQALQARVKRGKAVNVNDRDTKDAAIQLATDYFETMRPALAKALGESDAIAAHDERWQNLVRLAHGNNQRRTYASTLSTLAKELTGFSVALVARSAGKSESTGASNLTPAEERLVATLEELLPTAAASYKQGLIDLQGATRLSYRGTASEFREALRETLDYLAPDDDVFQQPGFSLEGDLKKPTMKQKVRYVMSLRGRSSGQRASTEKSVRGVEDLTADVLRATYDRASLATHVETTRGEVLRIKRYVDTILFDLMEIPE